jgi:septal ring factor EnvC (AmiA/AmiB activator)
VKRWAATFAVGLVVLTGASSASGGLAQSCDQRLKKQNTALASRLTKVTRQAQQLSDQLRAANDKLATTQQALDTATTGLDTANATLATTKAQLGAAQTGVPGTILTMQALDIWNKVLPAVTTIMRSSGPRWEADTYSSGDYLNTQYTWCGFC